MPSLNRLWEKAMSNYEQSSPLPKRRKTPLINANTKSNLGLVYNKFFDVWPKTFLDADFSIDKEKKLTDMKTNWVGEFNFAVDGAKELIHRQQEMVARLGGQSSIFKLTSPFVTGMGLAHPVENGFAWHHTLGAPYLAGSSIKGLTRAWATYWADDGGAGDEITKLFGPDKPEDGGAGDLIFFDCLPVSAVKLMPEIITPHLGDWRIIDPKNGLASHAPADWINPVPIPFLTVARGAEFQFCIASRSANSSNVEKGFGWMTDALCELGAGAKTGTGFGRFEKTGSNSATPREGDHVRINENASEASYIGRTGKINKIIPHAGKQFAQITPTDGAGKIKGTIDLEMLTLIPAPDNEG
jgi:CRISPR-associated protein Cmr6